MGHEGSTPREHTGQAQAESPAAPEYPGHSEHPEHPPAAGGVDLLRQTLHHLDATLFLDPSAPTRPSDSGQSTRETILAAASTLFAERGYHGASLRTISKAAGISHPGMLHHFDSKTALLAAVVDRLEEHAQALLDSAEQLAQSPAALWEALAEPWNPTRPPMLLLATLTAEIVDPRHPGRYRVSRLRLVHEHVFEEALTAYADKGLLTEGADPAFVARCAFSLLLSMAVREKSVRAQQGLQIADPVPEIHRFIDSYILEIADGR